MIEFFKGQKMKNLRAMVADKIQPVAGSVCEKLRLKGRGFAVIGGFVRDRMLGRIFDKNIESADMDVVLDEPIRNFRDMPGVRWLGSNTFGGAKFYLDGVGIIDICAFYQKGVGFVDIWENFSSNAEKTVGDLDFNCNAAGYLYPENQVVAAPAFFDFVRNKTISQAGARYGFNNTIAPCALRLKIKLSYLLKTQVGLDAELVERIRRLPENELVEYMRRKAGNEKIFRDAISLYKRISDQRSI
jgi:hypothetical protein